MKAEDLQRLADALERDRTLRRAMALLSPEARRRLRALPAQERVLAEGLLIEAEPLLRRRADPKALDEQLDEQL